MSKIFTGWAGPDLDTRIAAHVQAWNRVRQAPHSRPVETLPFVTISRQFGCEALPLAHRLVDILNERCRPTIPWVPYDQEVLDKVARELHLSRDIVESLDGHRRDEMSELFDAILNKKVDEAVVIRKIAEVVHSLATHGHAVLVGRGSHLITQNLRNGLHVRLEAPRGWRIHRVAADLNIPYPEAELLLDKRQREREHFVQVYFVQAPEHPFHHDLVIDNSRFNLAQIAEIIFTALSARFGETLVGA